MKRNREPLITAALLIIFSLILNLSIFKNIGSFLILTFTILTLVYVNGYYRYIYYKKQKDSILYTARKLYNKIPVYDVNFCKVEKIEKSDYTLVFLIVPLILIMMLFTVNSIAQEVLRHNIINNAKYNAIKWSVYLSYIYVVIFLFEDLRSICKFLFDTNVIFIKVEMFNIIEKVKDKECKTHHKHIYLMELAYKEYSIIDLKREKFSLEGKLERAKKPAFYDVYILPLIIVFVTGILSLVSTYIVTFMFSKGNQNNLQDALISYSYVALIVLITTLSVSLAIKKVSYSTIEDLKSRILVVEDLIKRYGI